MTAGWLAVSRASKSTSVTDFAPAASSARRRRPGIVRKGRQDDRAGRRAGSSQMAKPISRGAAEQQDGLWVTDGVRTI